MLTRRSQVAPTRRDGEITTRVLVEAGLAPHITPLRQLADEIRRGAAAVLLTDDVLEPASMPGLRDALASQPDWSDLPFVVPSLQGKVEFDTVEEGRDEQILERLLQGAVVAVFNRRCDASQMEPVVQAFKSGLSVETGESVASNDYLALLKSVDGLKDAIAQLGPDNRPAVQAAAIEFVLEGLHLSDRLNKDVVGGRARYAGT